MFKQIFLNHKWKAFIRNDRWRRHLLSKVLLSIFLIFVLSTFIIIGYNIDLILFELGSDPIEIFNSFIITYFSVDFLLRFFFQSLSPICFIPYLRFNLRHTELVNLMIIRSLWSFFNFIPWFIVLPFTIKLLYKFNGYKTAVLFIIAILLLVLINNILAFLIQFLARERKVFYLIPLSILLLLYLLPKIGQPISFYSVLLGTKIVGNDVFVFSLLLIILIFLIYLLRNLLLSGFYFEEEPNRTQSIRLKLLPFKLNICSKLGDIFKYISLEIKLILRNKRPKQTIALFPIFPVYLIICSIKKAQDPLLILLTLTFTFGMLSVLYGQYIFSWESSFFEIIMARRFNFFKYIKAKFYLMTFSSFVLLIVLIPIFLLFLKGFIVSLFAMYIFTTGTINFIILFSGVFNDGRITLNESFVFNYQGLNLNQLVLPLVVFSVPLGLYYISSSISNIHIGDIVLTVIGLVFLIFHNWWIRNIIMKIFKKRKYQNLEGYRKYMM